MLIRRAVMVSRYLALIKGPGINGLQAYIPD
jgi:hypothetical protein